MSTAGPDEDAQFAEIAARAHERNRDRATRLLEIVAGPVPLLPGDRREARLLAHTVAGSAGTFGKDEASVVARRVVRAVDDGAESDELRTLVEELLSALA
ncbi:hypothetical protein C8046_13655 [Serinibacter arcticus]|uniref:Uncharacterized protein n=1 Tax=Serinibacter arcticus TaxID=1655435 RepID=A0A2U1ZX26_9MICO|nr:Hpt domain-containing protein [Serinibacter arcticus]PWD51546.1 hypothetical protein C8046_13655 [Serinibacter arcticus]